ncbi:MAG: FKBP-type peptidyl-prolyl cis-trans isomerase [Ilumatobacter sp.]
MRRTLATTTLIALTLAACGGSDSSEVPVTAESTEEAAAEPTDDAADAPDDSSDADGDDSGDDDAAADAAPAQTVCPPDAAPEPTPKPEVDVPGEVSNELVTTVLTDGTGAEAVDGDTVVVDYVGVRSVDGEEFDNSYERGQPFPVTLGSGSVIQGWEDGLVGAQTGARIQLDIPPALAYGETARSEVIRENEPLTFVIDVRAVISPGDPSDAPTEPGVELSTGEGVADTVFEDLTEGDGEILECGDTAVIRYVNFRGDNGVAIESNWGADPLQVPFGDNLLPGLLEGMEGMQVGGLRAVTVPPEDGFGPDGNPQGGLPADTDMIFVIELIGTY